MINIIILPLFFNFHICQIEKYLLNNNKNNSYKGKENYPLLEYNSTVKRNVILGIIENYSLRKILPFFKSFLHANMTNCDIVIFVKKVSPIVINYLKGINVTVLQLHENYEGIKPTHLRWKIYSEFLKANKNEYNLVFSVDLRDAIFQKDVFKYYDNYSSFLGVVLEDDTLEEEWHKINIINYIGEKMYKTIQKERIICMGTLIGTLEKFLEFSIIIWEKLKSNNFPPFDQCVANCLFYLEFVLNDYLIKTDNSGPIMTIGITKDENIILDLEDNLRNYKGEIAAVVHQYDRKKILRKKIVNKYHLQVLDLTKLGLYFYIYIIFCIAIIIKLLKPVKCAIKKFLKK